MNISPDYLVERKKRNKTQIARVENIILNAFSGYCIYIWK